jgi:hypothetical protein
MSWMLRWMLRWIVCRIDIEDLVAYVYIVRVDKGG